MMEAMIVVCSGGFLGAILRFLITEKLNGQGELPIGTIIVNFTGALLAGITIQLDLPNNVLLFCMVGIFGALTTFSTVHLETIQLWQSQKRVLAIYYVMMMYIGTISFAVIGFMIGKLILQ